MSDGFFVEVERVNLDGTRRTLLHTNDITGDLIVYRSVDKAKEHFAHMVDQWRADDSGCLHGKSIFYNVVIRGVELR